MSRRYRRAAVIAALQRLVDQCFLDLYRQRLESGEVGAGEAVLERDDRRRTGRGRRGRGSGGHVPVRGGRRLRTRRRRLRARRERNDYQDGHHRKGQTGNHRQPPPHGLLTHAFNSHSLRHFSDTGTEGYRRSNSRLCTVHRRAVPCSRVPQCGTPSSGYPLVGPEAKPFEKLFRG